VTKRTRLGSEEKYQLLLDISNRTRGTLDLDEILNRLLDQLFQVLEYDAAGIFILNRDFVYPAHERPAGIIAGIVRRGFQPYPSGRDPMIYEGKGVIGHVISTGESAVIPNVHLDERYVVGRAETLAEIAVPILQGERPIGALNVESDHLAAYNEDDLEILHFFASAAAITIDKAMLHRQLLEKEQLEQQLETAQVIQNRLMPAAFPAIPGYQIDAYSLPAFQIGGDYYDFMPLENSQLGFVIADVSGDGIPAALVMSAFRAMLRTIMRREADLPLIAQKLNRQLPDFCGPGDFVTAILGILAPESGTIRLVICGHNPPLRVRTCGEAIRLSRGGPALGVFADARYEMGEISLETGDMLFLYTDGVIELANPSGDYFGLERLEATVLSACSEPAGQVIQAVLDDTRQFSGSLLNRDDFTMVILRRSGA
jgi:sigma-B regulation protein RsbU (phosphoserine phosphatase)